MSAELTARQQEILDLIKRIMAETGAPPTRAEIAAELGFRSPNAAEEHLRALERKGVIDLMGGTSRGIRLRPAAGGMPRQRALPGMAQLALPLVGRVAAGSPVLAAEHVERSFTVDPAMFDARPDYLLRVKGTSMQDAGILDGDLLAVQKVSQVRDGQIVVARVDDDVTVKRFKRTRKGVTLLPENPAFQPIEIPDGSPGLAIEGLVVGLIRTGHLA